jgi:hypothetical protein
MSEREIRKRVTEESIRWGSKCRICRNWSKKGWQYIPHADDCQLADEPDVVEVKRKITEMYKYAEGAEADALVSLDEWITETFGVELAVGGWEYVEEDDE